MIHITSDPGVALEGQILLEEGEVLLTPKLVMKIAPETRKEILKWAWQFCDPNRCGAMVLGPDGKVFLGLIRTNDKDRPAIPVTIDPWTRLDGPMPEHLADLIRQACGVVQWRAQLLRQRIPRPEPQR
jgi:hypothetical protein